MGWFLDSVQAHSSAIMAFATIAIVVLSVVTLRLSITVSRSAEKHQEASLELARHIKVALLTQTHKSTDAEVVMRLFDEVMAIVRQREGL